MIGVFVGWGFGAFIYFKVMFDWLFRPDITIIASILLATVFSVTIFCITDVYSLRLFKYNNVPGLVSARYFDILRVTAGPFFVGLITNMTVSRIVIFRFSKELNNAIDILDYNGKIDEYSYYS